MARLSIFFLVAWAGMIPFAMSATSFLQSGTAKEVVGALHGALAVVELAT